MKLATALLVILFAQITLANTSFIVKLKENENAFSFAAKNNVTLQPLSEDIGMYLAIPNSPQVTSQSIKNSRSSGLEYAQEDHQVKLRAGTLSPNDKNFDRQWNFTTPPSKFGIDAVEAWATHGTGGKDVLGNEIVIAVVDGGFDYNHPDLINNAWINKTEIPGNGKDDDGNGYVDDINGWNAERNNGKISLEDHGTHVAGIMGAQGNNSTWVTGVNWNIKIMYVSAGWSLTNTSTLMTAYGYILKQKKLWLASGGKEGANVVAINNSFGVDRANCNGGEYNSWNDMYNALGNAGILSVGATANDSLDVDRVGDVPTGCSSDYLVSVTNTESDGNKTYSAGYGVKTIDLGAPGTNIYSTMPYKAAGLMDGTSMATPHVTGAIGYLYSAASAAFINKAIATPGAAALEVKRIMLQTVTKRQKLATQTVSGGVLNLNSASDAIANY